MPQWVPWPLDLTLRPVARVLSGTRKEVERRALELLDELLASSFAEQALEHVLLRAVDSKVIELTMRRLMESDELWELVEEVAGSQHVTAAISQGGRGFADQVAGEVRVRSRRADATLERVVARALRRKLPQSADGEASEP